MYEVRASWRSAAAISAVDALAAHAEEARLTANGAFPRKQSEERINLSLEQALTRETPQLFAATFRAGEFIPMHNMA
jgi:hypothetical protein